MKVFYDPSIGELNFVISIVKRSIFDSDMIFFQTYNFQEEADTQSSRVCFLYSAVTVTLLVTKCVCIIFSLYIVLTVIIESY